MSSKDNWTYMFCRRRKKSFIICVSFQLCKLGNEFFCCVLIIDYIGILTTTSKGRILAQGTYGKKAAITWIVKVVLLVGIRQVRNISLIFVSN